MTSAAAVRKCPALFVAALLTTLSLATNRVMLPRMLMTAPSVVAKPVTTLPSTRRPSEALAVLLVVTIHRKFNELDSSINVLVSSRKCLAVVSVNALTTFAKCALFRVFDHEQFAALTVTVAAAAPYVKVGRSVPWPMPTTCTPALFMAMLVAVTVSACPGRQITMSYALAVQLSMAFCTVAKARSGLRPLLPSEPLTESTKK